MPGIEDVRLRTISWTTAFSAILDDISTLLRATDAPPMGKLSLSQARLLLFLADTSVEPRISTASSHLMLAPNNMTAIVGKLERAGLVTRRTDPDNIRCRVLASTAAADETRRAIDDVLSLYISEYARHVDYRTRSRVDTFAGRALRRFGGLGTIRHTDDPAVRLLELCTLGMTDFINISRELGFSQNEARSLGGIAVYPAHPTLKMLSSRIGIEQSEVSLAVDRLIAQELVVSYGDDEDRRMKRLAVTQEGEDRFLSLASAFEAGFLVPTRAPEVIPTVLAARFFRDRSFSKHPL